MQIHKYPFCRRFTAKEPPESSIHHNLGPALQHHYTPAVSVWCLGSPWLVYNMCKKGSGMFSRLTVSGARYRPQLPGDVQTRGPLIFLLPITSPLCLYSRCVFSSSCATMDDDPLNAPDFDPVAYLNHQFPSGKPPVSIQNAQQQSVTRFRVLC